MGLSLLKLQEAELDDLLRQAQTGPNDNSAPMNEIVRRFDDLAVSIGHRLTHKPDLQAVLANSARIELVKVVRRHRLGTPGFAAYAKESMFYAARRSWKRSRSVGDRETAVDPMDSESEYATAEAPIVRMTTWGDGRVSTIVSTLKPAQRVLLDQRYVEQLTLAEIGAQSGTSPSAVHQRLDTAHRVIRQLLTV